MLPIKIIQLPEHNDIKEELLDLIDQTHRYQIDHNDSVTEQVGPLTDWHNYEDEEVEEPLYYTRWRRVAEDLILDTVQYEFKYRDAELTNYWYQQYHKTYEHGWHFHNMCFYHAIYYLELPETAPGTMCRFPGGIEFTPNVKEGDILIMPSIVEHCSPPNKSRERKSIIAVNISQPEDD